jgi:hypothetical protein
MISWFRDNGNAHIFAIPLVLFVRTRTRASSSCVNLQVRLTGEANEDEINAESDYATMTM